MLQGPALSWQFFGVILETNLLTSKGSQKTSQLVDCPGKKTAHSPCLLSQVVWTVRVPPRLDLAVFRDSHAGQSWMNTDHGLRLFVLTKNPDNLGAPALAALAHGFPRTIQAACKASTACLT